MEKPETNPSVRQARRSEEYTLTLNNAEPYSVHFQAYVRITQELAMEKPYFMAQLLLNGGNLAGIGSTAKDAVNQVVKHMENYVAALRNLKETI